MGTRCYNVGSYDNPIYLIGVSGNWTLIEGGISSQFLAVKERLISIVGGFSDIKNWIILHTHYDHCGLLSYLYPFLTEVQVWAGEKAGIKLQKDKSIKIIESLNSDVIQLKKTEHIFNDVIKVPLKEIPINILLDNQVLTCSSNLTFTVIPSPGHSDCSISLFEQYSGRLFVSDALGEYFTPKKWFPLAFSSISDYLKSIKILEVTSPKIIALGHSECINGVTAKEAFEYSTSSTYKIIEEVQQQLKSKTKETIVKNMHQEYAYNSKEFVPDKLHYLSMKRLVNFISEY